MSKYSRNTIEAIGGKATAQALALATEGRQLARDGRALMAELYFAKSEQMTAFARQLKAMVDER